MQTAEIEGFSTVKADQRIATAKQQSGMDRKDSFRLPISFQFECNSHRFAIKKKSFSAKIYGIIREIRMQPNYQCPQLDQRSQSFSQCVYVVLFNLFYRTGEEDIRFI